MSQGKRCGTCEFSDSLQYVETDAGHVLVCACLAHSRVNARVRKVDIRSATDKCDLWQPSEDGNKSRGKE